MFNRKAKPVTRDDLEYMAQSKTIGCVCCRKGLGIPATNMPVEFNHHLHAGKRIGRRVGTPECQWHHRSVPRDGWTKSGMLQAFGPARHYQGGKGNFAATYGTDEQLREEHRARMEGYRGEVGVW